MRAPFKIEVVRINGAESEIIDQYTLDAGQYTIGRSPSAAISLPSERLSREHLTLFVSSDRIDVQDNGSTNGTRIGDKLVKQARWDLVTPIVIPGYEIRIMGAVQPQITPPPTLTVDQQRPAPVAPVAPVAPPRPVEQPTMIPPQQRVDAPAAAAPKPDESFELSRIRSNDESRLAGVGDEFPGRLFRDPIVKMSELRASGHLNGDGWEYLALGAGIGSFVWIDHLRCYGVPSSAIRAIGVDPVPYANYERYCLNSQIPRHERLRSNSISAPDNIWGFPGYASRETWRGIKRGKLGEIGHIMKVFGEPALAVSYVPTAGDVFSSMDVEMRRIGWNNMYIRGRLLKIRKTDDGRYAVAWRSPDGSRGQRDNITVGRYVHISTGYPATRFTDDLQRFRINNPSDRHRVVNAYEPHDSLYTDAERSGRPQIVVVRGRGIVASRVIQRLAEARRVNRSITIIHQMRSQVPNGTGSRYGRARRMVFNDVEHQPFNWPKACWGGGLRQDIEEASPERRAEIYGALGGTTTAWRDDWIAIARNGSREGWYRKSFGDVRSMEAVGNSDDRKVRIVSANSSGATEIVDADFIVDCTGLIADVHASPLLSDMIETYGLQQNKVSGRGAEQRLTGIMVTSDFEIAGMRNDKGHCYAAGTITQNGPYAAVDSFLGLQYAALRSVDHLGAQGASEVARFGPLRSFGQWLKWCSGASP